MNVVVLENMEEKVELIVAHILKVVFLPPFADSKAISIVPDKPEGHLGTHSVLPLLAIICRRILVAMEARPFFLRVP